MGRFAWIKMNGKNNKQVLIMSAYRVCKAGTNIGPHTAHMQQVNYLLKKGITNPNPRQAILRDMQAIIKEHQNRGGGVIVMMDANEDWEKDAGGEIAEFLLESQLEDMHKVRQQPIPKTTYTRGSKRLDYTPSGQKCTYDRAKIANKSYAYFWHFF